MQQRLEIEPPWAAARVAGEDPCVRKRWKSPQRRSRVQIGRHLQRSLVQSISESRDSFEVTTPLRAPLSIRVYLRPSKSCYLSRSGCVLAPRIMRVLQGTAGLASPSTISNSMVVHLRGGHLWAGAAGAAAAGRE